ncbi:MAG: class II aldolase/adducin family protein [Myxococcota bacterium]|nr:class II aldolase/adducin family protein [Myxococcota bacterium]
MIIGEGVTRFESTHTTTMSPSKQQTEVIAQLVAWRSIFLRLGVVGHDPMRYDGAGFGNLSGRIKPYSFPRGRRAFVITGTQTGRSRCMTDASFAVVRAYDWRRNRIQSEGPTRPSSEAMTHGAMYDLGPHLRFAFHVHSPDIWQNHKRLGLPCTDPAIEYGTPDMASEIGRLAQAGRLWTTQLLVMGGHEDGIMSFGRTADEAGSVLICALSAAHAYLYGQTHRLCD